MLMKRAELFSLCAFINGTFVSNFQGTPKQGTGNDCGVFMCQNAVCVSMCLPLVCSQVIVVWYSAKDNEIDKRQFKI